MQRLSSRQFASIFLLSVFHDSLIAFYYASLHRNWILLALLITFLLPFSGYLSHLWFVEADNRRDRFLITFYTAIGTTAGAAAVLLTLGLK